jgi:AcrR family transcriptional regulator
MNQFRWGEKTRQDSQCAGRDRILAAARICFENQGVEATSLEDIAREAQISRRTVYRYFENKQCIFQAIVEEQVSVFLQQMQKNVNQHNERFADLLKYSILYLVKYGPDAPGHQFVLGKDNRASTRHYYFSAKTIYQLLAPLMQEPFEIAQQKGEIRQDVEFRELMQWAGRIVFSYIQFPAEENHMEAQIELFLLAALR